MAKVLVGWNSTSGTKAMTLSDRLNAFKAAFPKTPASWPWLSEEKGKPAIYGVWVIGNDYRNASGYYGSYPPSYLKRVMALFPDATPTTTLHVFSGSLAAGPYTRCDLMQPAEFSCDVVDLPAVMRAARHPLQQLVIADPPYSAEDAVHYGTKMVNRRLAMAALSEITAVSGYLVWLDTVWPMHRKDQWRTAGRILIQRSTNHRARVCTIFERV